MVGFGRHVLFVGHRVHVLSSAWGPRLSDRWNMRIGGMSSHSAFRLAKRAGDGAVDDVCASLGDHAECDCPDFTFHRDGRDPAGCKHVRAARACGRP
jgi:hypothetical protein